MGAAPVITSGTSTTFTEGTTGTFDVTASGYPAPTFAETGTLPTGVTFSTAGVLSGDPTQTGSFPLSITATNSAGTSAAQSFTLTVVAAPFLITTTSLPDVAPSTAYGPVTLTTSGAGPGATFRWKATGLPKTLKLAATTGVLSGTGSKKLVAGTQYNVTFSVTETVTTVNGKKKTRTKTTATQVITITVS